MKNIFYLCFMDSNYEIVRELIEYNCGGGVDKYIHNNSTWLIFTDNKKWVIELTKDGTLWYNYDFFKNVLKYLSLDVVENQHYITKWVEETIINGVRSTSPTFTRFMSGVEETIQNGVKHTWYPLKDADDAVEDTIQNGVKHTIDTTHHKNKYVEDAIKNGVKDTFFSQNNELYLVKDTIENEVKETKQAYERTWMSSVVIQNGVKHTEYGDWLDGDERFDDIIQNGVKLTNSSLQIDGSCVIEDVIENGIKETYDDVYHHKGRVDGVIKNGIKETKLIDYLDRTEFIVDGVISRGVKKSPI